jgi:hypothetical protein
MSISGFIRGQYLELVVPGQKRRILKQPAPLGLARADWENSLREPTEFYLDCFRFFTQRLPAELQEHRAYFFKDQKGFGEDAMHVMWFLLFQDFKPVNFLEIGIFRGQTTSLAAMLARLNQASCEVWGISPFAAIGDSVTTYRNNVDYLADTLANFERFKLPRPNLLKAYSTDPEAVALIKSKAWDMIYIDGNHDYEVARKDWEVCSASARPGGIIVLDDAGLTTAYRPPLFATGGHPGPSRLAGEIDRQRFREILQVGHNRVFQKLA